MPRYLIHAAAFGLVIATPVATWWHVGQLNAAEGSTVTANVLFRPPALSVATETALGRVASTLVVASTAVLIVAAGRGVVDRGGWRVLMPLLLLGVFCGAYWRLLTATTPGWDIGSTLFGIFVAAPVGAAVVLGLVIWAYLATRSLRYSGRRRRPGGAGGPAGRR